MTGIFFRQKENGVRIQQRELGSALVVWQDVVRAPCTDEPESGLLGQFPRRGGSRKTTRVIVARCGTKFARSGGLFRHSDVARGSETQSLSQPVCRRKGRHHHWNARDRIGHDSV